MLPTSKTRMGNPALGMRRACGSNGLGGSRTHRVRALQNPNSARALKFSFSQAWTSQGVTGFSISTHQCCDQRAGRALREHHAEHQRTCDGLRKLDSHNSHGFLSRLHRVGLDFPRDNFKTNLPVGL